MLESLPFTILVSIVLGFLAGIGVGGGSLLILWLTLILGIEHSTARIINLFFFLPAALISTLFRRKEGKLNFKKALPAIIAGCASAALFTTLGKSLDISLLKKGFGILLLFTGLREFLYKPKSNHPRHRKAK